MFTTPYPYSVSSIGIIVAVIVSMILGMLWYSPLLFGKPWMRLAGMSKEMSPEAKRKANRAYALMLIPAIVMAYVVSLMLKDMFIQSIPESLLLGFFLWLGFVATTGSSEYIFKTQPKPWSLYLINVGYQLINILLITCVLFIFNIH